MPDHDEIVQAVMEAFERTSVVNRETHKLHHDYLEGVLERQRIRRERWEKVRVQVLGWSIIAVLGSVAKFVYDLVTHHK